LEAVNGLIGKADGSHGSGTNGEMEVLRGGINWDDGKSRRKEKEGRRWKRTKRKDGRGRKRMEEEGRGWKRREEDGKGRKRMEKEG
jgi:hypothetical protein